MFIKNDVLPQQRTVERQPFPVIDEPDFDFTFADEDFEIEAKELDGHFAPGHLPAGVVRFGNVFFTS